MKILPFLFSLTLFGAAFLSFSVQPILGKMLLPMVGGAPAGWIVAMAFFQLSLLAGYGLSYLLERFSAWVHLGGLLLLYGLGLFYLPPVLPEISGDHQDQALSMAVTVSLFKAIFVPFMALTATTSALLRVFASTRHPTARDPYYLFVASNLGSFAGLLCYPFFMEIFYAIPEQAVFWQGLYCSVVLLIIIAGFVAWRFKGVVEEVQVDTAPKTPVTKESVLHWLVLAFIPCSLSMGITTLITTDIAGVPLFWVIPLGLYLLTFILAFSRKVIMPLKKLSYWHINVVGFLICMLALGFAAKPSGDLLTFAVITFLLLEIFFVISWFCHQRLASLRPEPDKLAMFYFIIALGGGLAGILHAFVLPFVLNDVIEFPFVVLLSILLQPTFWKASDLAPINKLKKFVPVLTVISLVLAFALPVLQKMQVGDVIHFSTSAVFVLAFLCISSRPRLLLLVGGCVFFAHIFFSASGDTLLKGRNFFGSHAIYEEKAGDYTLRYFAHGNTRHGMAIYGASDDITYNNSYYAQKGPIRDVLNLANARSFGVIGLGVGQLACFDRSLTMDFYEIDSAVDDIARKHFPYLEECPVQNVYIGDGRLELEKTSTVYDVLLLDAFSSDGVPQHLLTKEAISLYKQHVTDKGVIMFNISNRYFDLGPSLAAVAEAEGLEAYSLLFKPDTTKNPYLLMSKWMAIPMSREQGNELVAMGWTKLEPSPRVWTDAHSSLLTAISINITNE